MQPKNFYCFFRKSSIVLFFLFSLIFNFLGNQITDILVLPFWLDSIGTFLIAGKFGPVAGGIFGGISVLLVSGGNHPELLFALTGIGVGIMAGLYFPRGRSDYFQLLCTAAITSITSVAISTPINMIFFDGHIGNIWGDALFNMLSQNGNTTIFCSILGQGFIDIPDKVLSLFIAYGILYITNYLNSQLINSTKEKPL